MRFPRAPSRIALPAIAAAVLAALATRSRVRAQTQADDCRPFETLFTQSGKDFPWTVGACCASIRFSCVSGRVTRFFTAVDNLNGTIPDLSGLTELQTLDLSSNRLTGPIPQLNTLTKLRNLILNSNQLTGAIPSLEALTNLWDLNVMRNNLTGNIDGLLPSSLISCDLGNNDVYTCGGTVPSACRSTVLVNDVLCAAGAPPPASTPAPNSSPPSPATKTTSSGATAGTNAPPPPSSNGSTPPSPPTSPGVNTTLIYGTAAGGAVIAILFVSVIAYCVVRRNARLVRSINTAMNNNKQAWQVSPQGPQMYMYQQPPQHGVPEVAPSVKNALDPSHPLPPAPPHSLTSGIGTGTTASDTLYTPDSTQMNTASQSASVQPYQMSGITVAYHSVPMADIPAWSLGVPPFPTSPQSQSQSRGYTEGTPTNDGSRPAHPAFAALVGTSLAAEPRVDFPLTAPPYTATHDYAAQSPDEMSLEADQLVKLKVAFRDGWGYGINFTTEVAGMVPLDCLAISPDVATAATAGRVATPSRRFESRMDSLLPRSGFVYGGPGFESAGVAVAGPPGSLR